MSFSTHYYNLKQSFDTVHLHSVLFVFLLLSLPFSIRKVFDVFSPDGSFNEYLDVSLYLSDILLIATLIIYVLYNKTIILSISYWNKLFHVEHLFLSITIPLFFILWVGLSISWSENALLATVSFIRLIEGYLLYVYIIFCNVPRGTLLNRDIRNKLFHVEQSDTNTQNVPRGTIMGELISYISKCSTWNILQTIFAVIIISGFFESIVAILQFIRQKSLGLTLLKESVFNVHDPGIAKIIINGDIFVRSYGLFPHPNILGGFLALSLLMTMAYPLVFKLKLFHVEQFIVIWLYRAIIFIQLLALFFSFSKSAIGAFAIGLIMLVSRIHKLFHVEQSDTNTQNVPRGTITDKLISCISNCSTWNNYSKFATNRLSKMFHVEQLLIICGIIVAGIILSFINLRLFLVQPFIERLFYINSIKSFIGRSYFEGLGIGQFVFDMQDFFTEKLQLWQLQPIHNVFLLIFSETGLVGLGLFLWFLIFAFIGNAKNVPRGTICVLLDKCSTWNNHLFINTKMFHVEQSLDIELIRRGEIHKKAILSYLSQSLLIVVVFIMLFDHYFWDIQQGQFLLWIVLAAAVSEKRY